MGQRDRRLLAYEMTLKGFYIGYIHPHYYFDAKAVHDILFYPSDNQHEIDDRDGTYYNSLKDIIENDKEIHIKFRRCSCLPRLINDWREGRLVKAYICSRVNEKFVSAWYKILPNKSLAGERPRSLFLTLLNGSEVVYKMTGCSEMNGYEYLTFVQSLK